MADVRITKARDRASLTGISPRGIEWLSANMHPSACVGTAQYRVGAEYAEDLKRDMELIGLEVDMK